MPLKISIITASYNNEATIRQTLQSVASQTYPHIEHIVVDGLSSDSTLTILRDFPHVASVISEKDKGIYDALNKGLKAATGDIIGFLHSDDVFAHSEIIARIAQEFETNPKLDGVYGDIVFVNTAGKEIRFYSSQDFKLADFSKGKMPAHTSFFARKEVYAAFPFNLDFKIAADFDQMLRAFYAHTYHFGYIPFCTTKMLTGGASTKNIQARITINKEILQSCKANGLKTNLFKVYSKYLTKIFEFKLWK